MDRNYHIGTSGWYYDHWKGNFYPKDLSKKSYFDFYKNNFRTVEVNNCFYHLPLESTFLKWKDESPEDFVFALKASRFITHFKRLKDPEESIPPFLNRAVLLGNKLGPILFQLPPRWPYDHSRLSDFLHSLPQTHRYTFEFRDPRWLNDESFQLLSDYNVALCLYDFAGRDTQKLVTADFIYTRLHGPEGPYQGTYSDKELQSWVSFFMSHASADIFCYFDNDEMGYAAQDALRLNRFMEQAMS
jgi:uncharacterized protein YecE (DUF72 family)